MKLQEIFPAQDYSDALVDRIFFARDASGFKGSCPAVAWPRNKDHLITLIKFGLKGTPGITIRGSGMNTLGASVPAQSLVVDMTRMNTLLELGSDFVTVETGILLSDLQYALKKKKLCFPLKPQDSSVCTLGGMLAMNCYGLDVSYGRMDAWVRELEVIDGHGNTMRVSGHALKDFIGLEGNTGIIVSAKLKVLSEIPAKTFSLFKFNTLTSLMDKVTILDKNPHVLSVTYFDDYCSELLSIGAALHLVVEYTTDSGAIKAAEEIEKIEEMREKLPHLLVHKKYTQKEDPVIPFDQIVQCLHWLQKNGVPCYGHLKHRILHPCFREGLQPQEEFYDLVRGIHGDLTGASGCGRKRKMFLSPEKKMQIKKLKETYDPERILNRGILID